MALTLNATAKSADANSYVTVAEATAYFEGRLDSAETWETAVSEATSEDVALVMATARLELEDYAGSRTTTTQRLKWPRTGTYDANGDYQDVDVVPRCVKEATYELALALLVDDSLLDDSGVEAFTSVSAGSLSFTLRDQAAGTGLPKIVRQLLAPVRTSCGNSAHIVRS